MISPIRTSLSHCIHLAYILYGALGNSHRFYKTALSLLCPPVYSLTGSCLISQFWSMTDTAVTMIAVGYCFYLRKK